MLKNKILLSVTNLDDIKNYREVGVTAFLFPLDEFSIGFPNTFKLDEIPIDNSNYILINRILDSKDVVKLKEILKNIPSHIKGIVYEDVAVFKMVKDLELDIELIWFQKHFGTSSKIINYWFNKGVDSAILSNEITKEEIEFITKNVSREVIVQVLGLNQVMYSRRLLLSNYQNHFKLQKKNQDLLTDKTTKLKFMAVESEYGTVFYYNKIYNGLSLLGLSNIKYFYINTLFIDSDLIMRILNKLDEVNDVENSDDGFLNKETIYKLKDL